MRRRWPEALALTVAGLGLMAAGWAAAGAVQNRPADPRAAGSGPACWAAVAGCQTDLECEAAEAAAVEAIEIERAEAKAYAEFERRCAAREVPCRRR